MPDVSVLGLLLRLVVSLAVVIGLMALAARGLQRVGGGGLLPARGPRTTPIQVLARTQLGRGSSVALVTAGGKHLVLGVTESSVTVLAEADPDVIDVMQDPVAAGIAAPAGAAQGQDGPARRLSSPWMAVLDALRDRTVRRS